jgi:tetratricopeptide (TPR) repeat protein
MITRILLCFACSLLASPIARAQDASSLSDSERLSRSKTLYEEGRSQFNLGNYPAAISAFERAYVLRPMPLFLYNLGQLYTLVGDRERAKHVFQRFLDEAPKAPERSDVEARLRELKRAIAANPQPSRPPVYTAPPEPAPVPPPAQPPAPVAAPTPAIHLTAEPAPVPPRRRARGWIAGVVIGTAVVVGGAIALGVVLATHANNPDPTLGRGALQ